MKHYEELIPSSLGWRGNSRHTPINRDPWAGLTPEEAYRKGVEDGRERQRYERQAADELANPKLRPRC